jgi:hypothetical protein
MAFLIGTDEAGYGPNLGPLVISASVWHVPDGPDESGLYRRLAAIVSPAPERADAAAASRVAIADSKMLYHSGHGLRLLERGLWAAWGAEDGTGEQGTGDRGQGSRGRVRRGPPDPAETEQGRGKQVPETFAGVWERLSGESAAARHAALSGGCDDQPAPLDADPEELRRLGPAFASALASAGVRLIALRSLAVFPAEFNEAAERYGSKGEALSRWTLGLVARLAAALGDEPISVVCDKHGGRNHYLPLLLDFFPEHFIETNGESRQRSVYRFGPPERRVEICFQAKGESHLPTALASMASKYLRELAMRAFCGFWCARVPGLRPTAGYPQDARRFRDEIAPLQRELGIEDNRVWRNR